MKKFTGPDANVLSLWARGADKSVKPAFVCNRPYNSVSINKYGNCFPCICEGWLPYSIGSVFDYNSLDELFNNPHAEIVQQDVDNKKFTWCAVDSCGINYHDQLDSVYNLWITVDPSCNLMCPSCRRQKVMWSEGPNFRLGTKIVEKIMYWLEKFDKPITINITGDGDPLASHIFRPMVKVYQPKPNQTLRLQTNGLLMKKILPDTPFLKNIVNYSISIDAASKHVYENVRRPGKWENLIENLDWLKQTIDLKLSNPDKVLLNFVVQKSNFRDIPALAQLAEHYGFIGALMELINWHTWSMDADGTEWTQQNGIFSDHNVLDKNHPDHEECMQLIHRVSNHSNITVNPHVKKILAERVGFEPTEDLHPR